MLKLYSILMSENFHGFEEVNEFIITLQTDNQFEASCYLKEVIRIYIVKNADSVIERLEKSKRQADAQQLLMYVLRALPSISGYDLMRQNLIEKLL